jgi:flagellar biogenesis protein FliO
MVQVIDRVNLDGRRSVYLVKVVDRLMILGVGGEQVTMLGEIKDESIVESVRSTDFSFHLGRIFNGLHAK